jgi:hypothetical protein
MARRSLLLIPALLFTAHAALADSSSITLGAKAPPAGAKYTEEKATDIDMTVVVAKKTIKMSSTEKQKKKVEVLASKDDVITKAKVTYEVDQRSKKQDGKSDGGASPIEGKTYTLTAGATIDVAGASGKAPDAEASVVREREKRFGKTDKMTKLLAGKKFDLGKPVDLTGPDVADAFADDPNLELKKLTLTYRGMDGKNAKFDMQLQIAARKPDSDMKFELSGKALIEPTSGEPIDMKLDGTVKQTTKAQIDGKVTMAAHRTM